MNIYGELTRNKIRLKIDEEVMEIKIQSNFYAKVTGKDAYHMFLDANTSKRIRDFVTRHRNKLGGYEKFRYIFLRNRVLLAVNTEVESLLTIHRVEAYATLSLDARVVYVMKSPEKGRNWNLDTLENCEEGSINTGNFKGDALIS